ncbi:uncharacterized protein JCM10292_003074 [Rhodotorula paludigena]|uniref:uncharacterized protein n=1 Tax=Rhodotorula paludigena TaxID=86838 RepID=UPI00317034BA
MPSAARAPGLTTSRPSSHRLHAVPYPSAQHHPYYLPNQPPGSVLPLPGPPQPGSHAHAEMAGTAAPVVARLDQLAAAWHGTPYDLLQYTSTVSLLLTTTTWHALSEKARNLLLELLNSTVMLAQSGCSQLSGLAQPFHYLAILGLDFDDRGAHYTAPPGVPFPWDPSGEPNFIYDPLAPSAVPGIPSLPPPTMSGSQNLPHYLPGHSTAGQAPSPHAVHHHVHHQHAHNPHPHTHPGYPPSSMGPHSLAHWHRRLNLRQAQRYRTTPERFRDAGLLE